jgi:hypothetical protein
MFGELTDILGTFKISGHVPEIIVVVDDNGNITFEISGNQEGDYVPVLGAVVDDNGTATFDIGVLDSESDTTVAFWSANADTLVSFYIGNTGLDSVRYWSGVSTKPIQGTTFGNPGTNNISTATHFTQASTTNIHGYHFPNGGDQHNGFSSTRYLSITPSSTEFNGFGAIDIDWSYGFQLQDDWIAQGIIPHMLSLPGSHYFMMGIGAYGDYGNSQENMRFGDDNENLLTGSNDASCNIKLDGWIIGNSGDLIIVTYDASDERISMYVDGTQKYSSNNRLDDAYLSPASTINPVTELRFGDYSGCDVITQYPADATEVGGWPYRIKDLFISVGTAYTQLQVNEIVADKDDITTSDNYSSMTTYTTFSTSNHSNVKGSAVFSTGTITL